MFKRLACLLIVVSPCPAFADELVDAVQADYDEYLAPLFDHFIDLINAQRQPAKAQNS